MLDYLERACEEIDAALFSGDALYTEKDLAEFQQYLDRWNREVENTKSDFKISDERADDVPIPGDFVQGNTPMERLFLGLPPEGRMQNDL